MQQSAATELASSQTFILELCALEAHFKGQGAWKSSLYRILETLQALGKAQADGAA